MDKKDLNFDIEELKKAVNLESERRSSLVAYLDVLGFKNHVQNYLNPTNIIHKNILKNYKNAFEQAKKLHYIRTFDDIGLIQYKQFSDSISLSMPNFHDDILEAVIICVFIHLVRSYYQHMLLNNFYLRGGVSTGFHYEDEDIIFSDSLIKAYTLENKLAMYPRIIIDNELTIRLKTLWTNRKEILSLYGMEKLIIKDQEGLTFINPFSYAQSMEKLISEGYTEKPSVYDKNKSLKTNLIEADQRVHDRFLEQIEIEIIEEKLNVNPDKRTLKKYLWLVELLNWNMDPDSSGIKFNYILK